MAEYDRAARTGPPRYLKPRQATRWRLLRAALGLEFHGPVRSAETQPGHGVGNQAQAFYPLEIFVPAIRMVAVHVRQKSPVIGRLQALLHFGGQHQCLRRGPLRQQPGMHHEITLCGMRQRPVAQPGEQLVAVGGGEDAAQRVVAMRLYKILRDCQQVQVMVAQHGGHTLSHGTRPAQHRERIGAAVDQVAHQPDTVMRRVEAELFQQ